MNEECQMLHELANRLKRYDFSKPDNFNKNELPKNGIYILFEKGELGHGYDRIVRIGTHNGQNRLYSRIKEHFIKENKDRSIFRKNIGRALIKKSGDNSFLPSWNLDLTARKTKKEQTVDFAHQAKVEEEVTKYITKNISLAVIEVNTKEERKSLESKLISTVSRCNDCKPSKNWLGKHSTKPKIVESGLWLVQELNKTPLTISEIKSLCNYAS